MLHYCIIVCRDSPPLTMLLCVVLPLPSLCYTIVCCDAPLLTMLLCVVMPFPSLYHTIVCQDFT